MKKTDLTSMTVAELRTLAKKKNVSLSAGSIKAAIVKAIMAVAKAAKPAAKRAKTAVKKTAKTAKKAVKQSARKKAASSARSSSKKTAAKKIATKKIVLAKKSASAKKPVSAAPMPKTATPVREWKMPPKTEEPFMAQERVAGAKYYTGPAIPEMPAHGELPQGYGEDKISIMMRDPFVAYAYWETSPQRMERERSWFGWNSKLCVRIYDVTGIQFDGRNAAGYFDQEVFERAGSWYFDLGRPSHSFCADLGLLSPEGRFLTLARSNYITMPQDGVSNVIDDEWMLQDEEFWRIYGYERFGRGVSSPEMQEMLKRRRELEITSPGTFSRDKAKRK